MLRRQKVICLVRQVNFLPESAFGADSFTVFIQPLCAFTCVNVSTQVDNPKHWQPHCLAAQKYSSHYPSLQRQTVAAQVVGELETVTYVSVPGKKIGILKTFFLFFSFFFIAYVAGEKRNAGGGGG